VTSLPQVFVAVIVGAVGVPVAVSRRSTVNPELRPHFVFVERDDVAPLVKLDRGV
jgi:hypothetical protein